MLVDALLQRGFDADLRDALTAIDRLAAVPTECGPVPHEIWLLRLRALLAQSHGDQAAYRDSSTATALWRHRLASRGMKWAEAMP